MNPYQKVTPTGLLHNNDEKCYECYDANIVECCNKCGTGVCNNESCSWLFPSYNKTNFALCNYCFKTIDKKLTPLVDYSKLQLLKKKIHKKLKKQIRAIE